MGEGSLLFPQRDLPLHAMVGAYGHSRQTSPAYDWYGVKRGRAEWALLQYTTAGRGALSYEDHRYEVVPGQAMLLHFPHENHYWLPADSDAWQFLYVCLHGSEVVRIWRELVTQNGPLVTVSPESCAMTLLREFVHSALDGRITSQFDASSLAYGLVMRLAQTLLEQSVPEKAPDAVRRAIAFCEQHVADDIGVEDIARAAGLSRYHFSRLFKTSVGVAPGEFVKELRLERAAHLLTDSRLSINAVALQCGFRDQNYFCRAFRKAIGLSPGQYRRSGLFGNA